MSPQYIFMKGWARGVMKKTTQVGKYLERNHRAYSAGYHLGIQMLEQAIEQSQQYHEGEPDGPAQSDQEV